MKKLHVALGVTNIEKSVREYSGRFGKDADLVIPHEYALWRTPTLNVSIRRIAAHEAGKLRHLGWEHSEAKECTSDQDCNGIVWEEFTAHHQAEEIEKAWPGTGYHPKV